jgi:hypothetical protein
MSAAFFPQIEGDNHGITSAVDGKALARSSELLDALAMRSEVSPLTSFISVHTDDFGFLEEAGLPIPEAKWFSARDGLKTVTALREACRAEDASDEALLRDLDGLEQVLIEADRQNRRWSLGVDM